MIFSPSLLPFSWLRQARQAARWSPCCCCRPLRCTTYLHASIHPSIQPSIEPARAHARGITGKRRRERERVGAGVWVRDCARGRAVQTQFNQTCCGHGRRHFLFCDFILFPFLSFCLADRPVRPRPRFAIPLTHSISSLCLGALRCGQGDRGFRPEAIVRARPTSAGLLGFWAKRRDERASERTGRAACGW
ncbi:hypothetical protein DFH27DRAFT_543873 [Peziza echinospora]|nr:hypothetical protein DFH27DRAFT_543873 [Peziza echinospora]